MQVTTSSSGCDVALWLRQPRLDSWCGQISSLRAGAPFRYDQQRCWCSAHDASALEGAFGDLAPIPAPCCSRSQKRNGETCECELAIPTCGDDCKYTHASPGFSRPTAQHTRAQSPDAIFKQHAQEPRREVLHGQLDIETFFSRAVYMAKLPMHFLQDCLGAKSRVRHTAKSCAVGRPRHECLAKRKKTRQDFLR